jgi:required for meiotic nuclear division protein 1
MQSWGFRSIVLGNEINLNIIANHFGINKKYKWGDPLYLSETGLSGIVRNTDNKGVYIYHFGALVCVNMEYHEIQDFVKYLKEVDLTLKNNPSNQFFDEYKLEIDPSYEYTLYNDAMTASELLPYYQEILALVLAKSTSMRKIETDTDALLDSIEKVINYLDTGKFNMPDQEIATTSAKILRFKYNTISYLMLLDKPRSAWNNEDIENFYLQMVSLFEIDDRYENLHHKTEVLQDITDVFSTLTHEKRGTSLEIMVIILILSSIIISVIKFFLK